MKKVIIFLAATIFLFADILANIESEILTIDQNRATIKSVDAPIGSSGIVVHKFDENHSTIVAKVELIDSNMVKFSIYEALKQESLPTPNILPKIGDKVILNYLYDRGLIIAPNFKMYDIIKKTYPNIEWLHPDLFVAQLSKDQNPVPKRKDFSKFCNKYAVGLVYIATNNRGFFVDCQSFKVIKDEKIKNLDNKIKLPFYSRIDEIKSSWLEFYKDSKIKNYDEYYKNLMELKWSIKLI